MDKVLERNNLDLLQEIEASKKLIKNKKIPNELIPFRKWITSVLVQLEKEVNRTLILLRKEEPSILIELLKRTQNLTSQFRFINKLYIPPLYRFTENDQIVIKLLSWIHSQHPQTQGQPFAISDGDFSVTYLKSPDAPLVYYLPITSQKRCIHFPLFFHEFGHYLYLYHRQEMDDIVRDFQTKLEEYLMIPIQHNDETYLYEVEANKQIVETWYDWMQELFCDAIGLTIGGPSYLYAFSLYLRMRGKESFHKPIERLAKSSHPVSWLRTKFLVKRAREYDLHDDADLLEDEWRKLAKIQEITEDYFGYYTDQYDNDIIQSLNDMLIEANPISFKDLELTINEFNSKEHNFIQLVNLAWNIYMKDPNNYINWEEQILNKFIE